MCVLGPQHPVSLLPSKMAVFVLQKALSFIIIKEKTKRKTKSKHVNIIKTRKLSLVTK